MSYNFDTDQNHYYFNNKNSLPIIFIHGVGLNQQMWKPQIEFFKDNSFITYDLLGHGKTPFKEPNLSMENFTDQLSNLVNNLKIDKFNLIGFSIGSLIAIEFASKYENYLNSLTLISTTYKRTAEERQNVIDRVNLAKKNMPISQMAMKRWFSDKYLEQNPELYDEFMNILNKKGIDQENFIKAYEVFANYEDNLENIKNIKINTLIITGSDDPGSTPDMSKNLNKDIQNSTYVEIKNAKHLCSIEYADEVNNAIMKHINNA